MSEPDGMVTFSSELIASTTRPVRVPSRPARVPDGSSSFAAFGTNARLNDR
jgi:hypothetical protein